MLDFLKIQKKKFTIMILILITILMGFPKFITADVATKITIPLTSTKFTTGEVIAGKTELKFKVPSDTIKVFYYWNYNTEGDKTLEDRLQVLPDANKEVTIKVPNTAKNGILELRLACWNGSNDLVFDSIPYYVVSSLPSTGDITPPSLNEGVIPPEKERILKLGDTSNKINLNYTDNATEIYKISYTWSKSVTTNLSNLKTVYAKDTITPNASDSNFPTTAGIWYLYVFAVDGANNMSEWRYIKYDFRNDLEAPEIKLEGKNPQIINLRKGETYVEAGATATDKYDNVTKPAIVDEETVNEVKTAIAEGKPAIKTVKYTAVDNDRNVSETTREVHIIDDTELKTLVDNTKSKYNKDDYTTESWNNLQKVLTDSEKMLSGDTSIQADIEKQIENLTNTINNLVNKSVTGMTAIYEGGNVIEGTKIDETKVKVTLLYDNGTSEVINSGYTINNYEIVPNTNRIMITYNANTNISAEMIVTGVSKQITKISKIEYTGNKIEGQDIDTTDFNVTVEYDNGTTRVLDNTVENAEFTINLNTLKVGNNDITVTLKSHTNINGTITVNATEKQIKEITKVEYKNSKAIEGQTIGTADFEVTVEYDNGKTGTLTSEEFTINKTELVKGNNVIEVTLKSNPQVKGETTVTATGKQITRITNIEYTGDKIEGQDIDTTDFNVTVEYDNGKTGTLVNTLEGAEFTIDVNTLALGDNRITVTLKNPTSISDRITVTTTEKQIIKITKVEYKNPKAVEGQTIGTADFEVTVKYDNGKTGTLTSEEFTINKTELVKGNNIIEATLKSNTSIKGETTVVGATKQITEIKSAEYTGAKIEGKTIIKDEFTVVVVYDNGKEVTLTSEEFTINKTELVLGENNITVTAGSQTKDVIFNAVAKKIKEITKVEYIGKTKIEGQTVNTAEFKVTVEYDNGKTAELVNTVGNAEFTISPETIGLNTNTVTITAGGKTKPVVVPVIEKVVTKIEVARKDGNTENLSLPVGTALSEIAEKIVVKAIYNDETDPEVAYKTGDVTDGYELSGSIVISDTNRIEITYTDAKGTTHNAYIIVKGVAKSIENATYTATIAGLDENGKTTYDGTGKSISISDVKLNNTEILTEGTDYTVTINYYEVKETGDIDLGTNGNEKILPTNVGKYKAVVTISGMGNYGGTVKNTVDSTSSFTYSKTFDIEPKNISSAKIEKTLSFEFDGTPKEALITVKDEQLNKTLELFDNEKQTGDYIKTITYKQGGTTLTGAPTNVGEYKVIITIQGKGNYTGTNSDSSTEYDFTITPKSINPDNPEDPTEKITINGTMDIIHPEGETLSQAGNPIYDGKDRKLDETKYTVNLGSTKLTKGTDYKQTITYYEKQADGQYKELVKVISEKDGEEVKETKEPADGKLPKNAGTYKATIKIEGAGNYTGTYETTLDNAFEFTIDKKELKDEDIVFENNTRELATQYTGEKQPITAKVKDELKNEGIGTLLNQPIYYKVTDFNADKKTWELVVENGQMVAPTNAGKYLVFVSIGEGTNYKAKNEFGALKYEITPIELTSSNSEIEVSYDGQEIEYTGKGIIDPTYIVKASRGTGKVELVKDTDYVQVGNITYKVLNNNGTLDTNGKPVALGEYSATVTISGKGNYTGTKAVEINFTIGAKSIKDMSLDVSFENVHKNEEGKINVAYDGKAKVPTVVVKNGEEILTPYDEKTGLGDYEVQAKYVDGKGNEITNPTAKDTYEVKIKVIGKGNYKDKLGEDEFSYTASLVIGAKSIKSEDIKIDITNLVVGFEEGQVKEPTITVTDTKIGENGTVLTKADNTNPNDYSVSIEYTNSKGEITETVSGKGDYTAKITITGNGNYTEFVEKTINFKIEPQTIKEVEENVTLKIEGAEKKDGIDTVTYTGNAPKLDVEITDTINGEEVTLTQKDASKPSVPYDYDYTVTYAAKEGTNTNYNPAEGNPVNAGTYIATVVITGNGKYADEEKITKTHEFTILPRNISEANDIVINLITEANEPKDKDGNVTYNGKDRQVEVEALTIGTGANKTELVLNTDYTQKIEYFKLNTENGQYEKIGEVPQEGTSRLPKEAGDYKAVVTVTAKNGGNYTGTKTSQDYLFKIAKTAPKADDFKLVKNTATYTGMPVSIEAVSTKNGMGTVTISKYVKGGVESKNAPVEAGTYTILVNVADNGENYSSAENLAITEQFTIEKRDISTGRVTASVGSDNKVTFNGSEIVPQAVLKVTEGGTEYTIPAENYTANITYTKDGEAFTGKPVEKGNYVATITLTGTGVNCTGTIKADDYSFTIESKSIKDIGEITVKYDGTEIENKTINTIYDGTEKIPEIVVNINENNKKTELKEYNPETKIGDYTKTITYVDKSGNTVTNPTNAGTYTGTVKVTGTGNYKDIIEDYTFTLEIEEKEITANGVIITVPVKSAGYDGTAKEPVIKVQDTIADEVIDLVASTKTDENDYSYRITYVKVGDETATVLNEVSEQGTYTATIVITGHGNYKGTKTITENFIIGAKSIEEIPETSISIKATGAQEKEGVDTVTYNGKTPNLDVVVKDTINGIETELQGKTEDSDDYDYAYSVLYKKEGETSYSEAKPVDVGTYTAKVTITGHGNYYNNISKEYTFKIEEKDINASGIQVKAEVENAVKEENKPDKVVFTGKVANMLIQVVDNDIKVSEQEGTTLVSKLDNQTKYDYEYSVFYKKSSEADEAYTENVPTAVGTYTAKITATGHGNYKNVKEVTYSFEIVQKSVQDAEVEVGIFEKGTETPYITKYNKVQKEARVTKVTLGTEPNKVTLGAEDYEAKIRYFKDNKNGQELLDENNNPKEPVNAGTYVAVVKIEGKGNYTGETREVQYVITINKAIPEKKDVELAKKNYEYIGTGINAEFKELEDIGKVTVVFYRVKNEKVDMIDEEGNAVLPVDVGEYDTRIQTAGGTNYEHRGTFTGPSIKIIQHSLNDNDVELTMNGISADKKIEYDGKAKEVIPVVKIGDITLPEKDYTSVIKYKGTGTTEYEETTEAPTERGTYEAVVTVNGIGNCKDSVEKTYQFEITAKSVESDDIRVEAKVGTTVVDEDNEIKLGYTGKEVNLAIKVYDGETELTEYSKNSETGKTSGDYILEVKYTNLKEGQTAPIDQGRYTANVKVTGKGNYEGTELTKTFEIVISAKSINDDTIAKLVEVPDVTYGNDIVSSIELTDVSIKETVEGIEKDKVLIENTDYTVSENKTYKVLQGTTYVDLEEAPTEVGKYQIVIEVTGQGNYTGTRFLTENFEIKAKTIDDQDKDITVNAKVGEVSPDEEGKISVGYTGEGKELTVIVKDKENTLNLYDESTKTGDYTLNIVYTKADGTALSNGQKVPTDVGSYKAVVTITGKGNYATDKPLVKTYIIVIGSKSINDNTVTGRVEVDNIVYGEEITVEEVLTDTAIQVPGAETGKTLVKGTDYDIKLGTDEKAEITYEGIEGTVYSASKVKPTEIGKYKVKITVIGKGNYEGERTIEGSFEITAKEIDEENEDITIEAKVGEVGPDNTGKISVGYTGEGKELTVTVKDKENKLSLYDESTKTGDYTQSIVYTKADGTALPNGKIVPTDMGEYTATVTIEGKGNYKTTTPLIKTYTIVIGSKSINDNTVTGRVEADNIVYGEEITVEEVLIDTAIQVPGAEAGKTLVKGTDYDIKLGTDGKVEITYEGIEGTVYSASKVKPTEAGKYKVKVTVEGKGNYTEERTVEGSFEITAKGIDSSDVSVSGNIEDGTVADKTITTVYNGSPATLTIALQDKETDLSLYNETAKTGDYTASTVYTKADGTALPEGETAPVNVGSYKAVVTIEGKGNYGKTRVEEYNIEITAKPIDNDVKITGTISVGEKQDDDNIGKVSYGEAIEPVIELVDSGIKVKVSAGYVDKVLAKDVDYTYTISDIQYKSKTDTEYTDIVPTELGEYDIQVTVTGKGNYKGTKTLTGEFEIIQKSLANNENVTVTAKYTNATSEEGKHDTLPYTGVKLNNPKVTVTLTEGENTKTLVENTDFIVTKVNYSQIVNGTLVPLGENERPQEIGIYVAYITVEGTNSYTGTPTLDGKKYSAEYTFEILPKSIEGGEIEVTNTEVTYNGTKQSPSVRVTLTENDEKVIVPETDYDITISYTGINGTNYETSNVAPENAGTYMMTITATGKGNHTGTIVKENVQFVIAKRKINVDDTIQGTVVVGTENEVTFESPVTKVVTLKDTNIITGKEEDGVTDIYRTLIAGTDYTISTEVKYVKVGETAETDIEPTAVGAYEIIVKVTGQGNYEGEKTLRQRFKIAPKSIANIATVTAEYENAVKTAGQKDKLFYNPEEQVGDPTVTVTITEGSNTRTLTEGTEYQVTRINYAKIVKENGIDKEEQLGIDEKPQVVGSYVAYITVEGIGNYSGIPGKNYSCKYEFDIINKSPVEITELTYKGGNKIEGQQVVTTDFDVIVRYDDNTSRKLENGENENIPSEFTVSYPAGQEELVEGKNIITIRYTENGKTVSKTYELTVIARVITEITEVKYEGPQKIAGQQITAGELKVTVKYNDGTIETLTDSTLYTVNYQNGNTSLVEGRNDIAIAIKDSVIAPKVITINAVAKAVVSISGIYDGLPKMEEETVTNSDFKIIATFNDETTAILAEDSYKISYPSNIEVLVAGNNLITITYINDETIQTKVNVNAKAKMPQPTPQVTITPAVIEITSNIMPKLNITGQGPEDGGKITYSAEPAGSIMIDELGNITALRKTGIVTITVTYGGTKNYRSTSADVILEIKGGTLDSSKFQILQPSKVYNGKVQMPFIVQDAGVSGIGTIVDRKFYQNGIEVEPIEVGEYEVRIDVAGGSRFEPIKDLSIGTFTITKARYDMTNVSFIGKEFEYSETNGAECYIYVTENINGVTREIEDGEQLSNGLTVTYTGNGQTNPGDHKVYAKFTGDVKNYELVEDMRATIKINGTVDPPMIRYKVSADGEKPERYSIIGTDYITKPLKFTRFIRLDWDSEHCLIERRVGDSYIQVTDYNETDGYYYMTVDGVYRITATRESGQKTIRLIEIKAGDPNAKLEFSYGNGITGYKRATLNLYYSNIDELLAAVGKITLYNKTTKTEEVLFGYEENSDELITKNLRTKTATDGSTYYYIVIMKPGMYELDYGATQTEPFSLVK